MRVLTVWIAMLVAGCQRPTAEPTPREPTLADRLSVSPDGYDFSNNPKLLERIVDNPHGYFRFINVAFSEAVCKDFATEIAGLPIVNLHGDAHLEQYAVTDIGRGLTDFDDSSRGPALLDLIRFGVSVHLALEKRFSKRFCRKVFRHFIEGYKSALENPSLKPESPAWTERTRSKFTKNRKEYFDWIRSIVDEIPKTEREAVETGLADYVIAMRKKHPELSDQFFSVVEVGRLRLGIGSALDQKYLVRIQGPSDEPLDDAVLEVKEVRSLAGVSCIEGATASDPFRILLAQANIAYEPYAYLGYIVMDGKNFWIHAWVDNYKELKLSKLPSDKDELKEIVYDVGVQLGRGHPKLAGDFQLQLRQAQERFLTKNERKIEATVEAYAEAVTEAWSRFQKQHTN